MSSVAMAIDSCQVLSAGRREFQERDPVTKAPLGPPRTWHSLELSYEGGKMNIGYEENDPNAGVYAGWVGKRVSGLVAMRQNKSAFYVDRIIDLQVDAPKPAAQGSKA